MANASLREHISDAAGKGIAVGHFNVSNLEAVWGIVRAAKRLGQPVIIGVSEGERDFVGVREIAAVVKALREDFYPDVYLNADHTYSFERVKEAIDAGFDAVIYDGAQHPLEDNIRETKRCVEYARASGRDVLIEGEIGYIGTSSKLLDAVPDNVVTAGDGLTDPEDAKRFVAETGVDLLAPAVGNVHGMMKVGHDPRLDIARVKAIREAAGVPLVLHGGSGTVDDDFVASVKAGMAIVHINTELRVAFRTALELALQEERDEIAPYKYMKGPMKAVEKAVEERIRLFAGM